MLVLRGSAGLRENASLAVWAICTVAFWWFGAPHAARNECARGDLNRARPTLVMPELASLSVK